jgi:hypothetical protein
LSGNQRGSNVADPQKTKNMKYFTLKVKAKKDRARSYRDSDHGVIVDLGDDLTEVVLSERKKELQLYGVKPGHKITERIEQSKTFFKKEFSGKCAPGTYTLCLDENGLDVTDKEYDWTQTTKFDPTQTDLFDLLPEDAVYWIAERVVEKFRFEPSGYTSHLDGMLVAYTPRSHPNKAYLGWNCSRADADAFMSKNFPGWRIETISNRWASLIKD